MGKQEEKDDFEKRKERINQFIIECIFNKYFEEEKDNKVDVENEKILA
ncbi:MAG: hypothetical protein WC437_05710 [Patescibacteria group bacterium]